jgi:hypothetical protein
MQKSGRKPPTGIDRWIEAKEDRVGRPVNGESYEHEGMDEHWIRSIGDVAASAMLRLGFCRLTLKS